MIKCLQAECNVRLQCKAESLFETVCNRVNMKLYEELALTPELDKRKLKYEPHFVIGKRFEIDIAFPKKKLAVEADGDYWHSLPKQILADGRKNDYLKSIDWNIMRFTESEINDDVKSCADKIIAQLGGDN